jgi:hypothetical protein
MIEFGMSDSTVQVVLKPQLQLQIPAAALDQVKRSQVSVQRDAIKPLAKP